MDTCVSRQDAAAGVWLLPAQNAQPLGCARMCLVPLGRQLQGDCSGMGLGVNAVCLLFLTVLCVGDARRIFAQGLFLSLVVRVPHAWWVLCPCGLSFPEHLIPLPCAVPGTP